MHFQEQESWWYLLLENFLGKSMCYIYKNEKKSFFQEKNIILFFKEVKFSNKDSKIPGTLCVFDN